MKIVACYIVCNEERLIAESLRSVKAYVDGYVIVDSSSPRNPVTEPHSTDQTRAVCEKTCSPLPLTYIESTVKLTLQSARNRYLKEVSEGDWVFVIDADEVLYGDHSDILAIFENIRTGKTLDAVSIPVYTTAVLAHGFGKDLSQEIYKINPLINTVGYMTRFFRNEAGIQNIDLGTYDRNGVMLIDGKRNRTDKMFLINHHTRQTHAYYVNNCVREIAEGKALRTALDQGSHLT